MTRYYHDGVRPIFEAKGDGSLQAQLERDIFGNLLARKTSGGTWYYHHDGLGSTVGLTDASGQVAAQRTYDAWGNRRTSSGSAPGNYQFTGAELDPTSGLYHMGARFYDPMVGRWLSEDPVQDKHFEPVTLNFYAYTGNNPLILVDPDGETPFAAILLLGAVAFVASYAIASKGQMTWQGVALATITGAAAAAGAIAAITRSAALAASSAAGTGGILGELALRSGARFQCVVNLSNTKAEILATVTVVKRNVLVEVGLLNVGKGSITVGDIRAMFAELIAKAAAAGFETLTILIIRGDEVTPVVVKL